jgi:acetyltransferase
VGKEAAVTHTGSLAGDEKVFFAALRQAGAISVNNMNQMVRIMRVLQPPYPRLGGRLAFISAGGGNTVNICDLFSGQPHLSLPRLAPETMRAVQDLLPEENVDVRNPVDPGATGLLKMDRLIKAVGQDPGIETLGIAISVDFLSNIQTEENRVLVAEMISETVARLAGKLAKPIFILLRQERENHEDCDRYRRIMVAKFNEKAVPWMDGSFANVAENFSKLAAYREHLEKVRRRNAPEAAGR